MRPDIKKFVLKVCSTFKLEAYYLPSDDIYCITKRGMSIRVFTTKQFDEIPKVYRFHQIGRMLRLGLNHNLGESYRDQVFHQRKIGIKIA